MFQQNDHQAILDVGVPMGPAPDEAGLDGVDPDVVDPHGCLLAVILRPLPCWLPLAL